MIECPGENAHPGRELGSCQVLQYGFIENEGIDFSINERLQTIALILERKRRNAVFSKIVLALGLGHRADADSLQIAQSTHFAAQLADGERGGDGGRKAGDQNDRCQHPDNGNDPPAQCHWGFVAVAHGGHRYRGPPDAVPEPLDGSIAEHGAVPAALEQPHECTGYQPQQDQGADNRQKSQ